MQTKPKMYPCKVCGREVIVRSKGKCPQCRQKDYISNGGIRKLPTKPKRDGDIKLFFDYHLQQVRRYPICENCGDKLNPNITVIAHILPKRGSCHPEVADNLDNAMYLCSRINGEHGCHDLYDRIQGNEEVYSMNCWRIAVNRYKKFRDKVNYTKYSKIFDNYLQSKGGDNYDN